MWRAWPSRPRASPRPSPAREDVRLAERLDAADGALQVADVAERLGLHHPVGLLVERDDADLVPRRHRRGCPQDRLLADVDLADAADPAPGPPWPRPSNVLQWQASIEPDLSMTTTSATSGCSSRLRTPMSTGSVSSIGLLVTAGAVRVRAADHHEALAEVADDRPGARASGGPSATSAGRRRGRSSRTRRGPADRSRAPPPDRVDVPGARSRGRRSAPRPRPRRRRRRASAARPWTIVFASARSFWLNVFRAASTTTRKRRKPASAGVTRT